MNNPNKKPPLTRVMATSKKDKNYLRNLKRNYAMRKDNIAIINSYNELTSTARVLTVQLAKSGGGI